MSNTTNHWTDVTDFHECIMCFSEYEPSFDNVTILLNCYHKFHTDCLIKYIKFNQTAIKQAAIQEAELNENPHPTEAILNTLANMVECPYCKTIFFASKLTYNNYKNALIWPIYPKAPEPMLPDAPEDIDDILIYEYKNPWKKKTRRWHSWKIGYVFYEEPGDDYPAPSIRNHNNMGSGLPSFYYQYYKDNLKARCPYPHMLQDIQIPQPTDSLEFIEMQYEAAVRNNKIALNDYMNAIECNTPFYESFIQSKGIAMSDIDIAYNAQMPIITNARLVETERVKTTIKQILDDAKTLLGRFKSGIHHIRDSVSSKTIKKRLSDRAKNTYDRARNTLHSLRMRTMPNMYVRIEGGKHNKSRKRRKPRKHSKSRKH
jgi:hypothetical protein